MKILDQLIGRQIRRPTGLAGRILGNLMAAEHRSLTSWMFEYLAIDPANYVLDVGCGGGMTLKTIAATTTAGLAVGIDYSPTMTRQAARRNRSGIGRGNVSVLAGNVLALPFADASFDVACGVETFYFWPDPLCGLKEIKRVLKPGGRLGLVMDISKEVASAATTEDIGNRLGFRVYSGEEMKSMLTGAGFSGAHFEALPERGKGWLYAGGYRE